MATFQEDFQYDEEAQGAPQAGGPSLGSAGAASAGANAQTPETTGFVNFDRYFNTNAGTANQMAQNVASNVQQRGDKATAAVKDATDTFNQNVAAGASTVDKAYSGPAYFGDGQDLRPAYDAINDATTAYNALGSFGGRQALLEDQNANTIQNYSKGMSRFDTALLGRAGGEQFQDMQNNFAGFDGWLADATDAGQKAIDDASGAYDPNYVAPPEVVTPEPLEDDEDPFDKRLRKDPRGRRIADKTRGRGDPDLNLGRAEGGGSDEGNNTKGRGNARIYP